MFDLQNISSFLSVFSLQSLGLNFIDLIIIIVVLFYMYEGYSLGFFGAIFDLLSFILSFIVGIKFYSFLGRLISNNFSIAIGFANAIGFFIAASVSEIFLNLISRRLLSWSSGFTNFNSSIYLKKINKFLGLIPGVLSALVLLSFFLTLIVSLPLSPFLKRSVSASRIGSLLVSKTSGFEKSINDVFGGAVHETINFLTVEPQSDEFVNLKFKTDNFNVDPNAEKQMLEMVNKERLSRGLSALIFDNKIRDVARSHSEDMLKRGYFSHFTPEKFSPFDRMAEADIHFTYAGENLALAPSTDLAMQGLMNSPGHKANILSKDFGKIGIGAIDGGIYGLMFTQNFTD